VKQIAAAFYGSHLLSSYLPVLFPRLSFPVLPTLRTRVPSGPYSGNALIPLAARFTLFSRFFFLFFSFQSFLLKHRIIAFFLLAAPLSFFFVHGIKQQQSRIDQSCFSFHALVPPLGGLIPFFSETSRNYSEALPFQAVPSEGTPRTSLYDFPPSCALQLLGGVFFFSFFFFSTLFLHVVWTSVQFSPSLFLFSLFCKPCL